MMKVVLLTNTSMESEALASLLVHHGINLTKVIKVRPKQKTNNRDILPILKRYLSRIKTYLTRDRNSKLALKFEQRCKENADKLLENFIQDKTKHIPKMDVETVEVSNVNNKHVAAILKLEAPDICIVFGTGIIKKRILSLVKSFMNIHSSVLPHYKGTRSEFWQCHNKEYEHLGITIHFIDKGVDTGDLIEQFRLPKDVYKEPYHLRAQNMILALNEYPRVIKSILDGHKISRIKQLRISSKVYKFSDITLERRVELYSELYRVKYK